MPQCLICKTDFEPFLSLGKMPIANGFLTPEQFGEEYFFQMQVAHCPNCNMVQLTEQPDREMMFHDNYAFFSSTSKGMMIHFKEFADLVMKDYLNETDPFVVELGSNDGIMLQNFANANIRHLGIEPSANVAKVAVEKGIATICEFFDKALAEKIVQEHGQADAILAANVMCHIPYLHSIAAGFKTLLKPDGIIMFEDPYLGNVIEEVIYDQIYDEHVFLFSVASISFLFEQYGLQVVDVMPQTTHGGSMRYAIAHKGAKQISDAVTAQRSKEQELGLHLSETYEQFRKNVELSRDELVKMLTDLKARGKRVVGYAATSKSTTINNYCGINSDLVEFISDTTPIKQGKYSPGTHIPVKPYQDFCDNYPDYALLYAYNHAKEILAKEQSFKAAGGKWILYAPKAKVLE
jgi:methylation protein EvaC